MSERVLHAAVETGRDGAISILSPAIGLWRGVPAPGALLGPGARIGSLEQGSRSVELRIPEGIAGTIGDGLPKDRVVPVEHGQVLFRLRAVDALAAGGDAPGTTSAAAGLAPGTFGIAAPTDGIFYASSAPGAPAFVHVGSRISAGQPVGLVEVMKTFNQILYGGPGFPDQAEVIEVRCADRAEIRAGQLLFVIR